MKKIFIVLCSALFLMGCNKQSVKLISAVKQTIIPGRPNLPKYNNYVVNFSLEKDMDVVIDKVQVFEDKTSYTSKFTLKKAGTASVIKSLSEKGTYVLEVPLREKNIITTNSETKEQNQLIIFYSKNNKPQQLKVTKFKTDTVTKRSRK